MKPCRLCQEVKPLDDYYVRYTTKDRRDSVCKTCHKARTAKRKREMSNYRTVSVPIRCIPIWLTNEDIVAMKSLYHEAREKTVTTGRKWVVDHIYPMRGETVSGLHVPTNLRVILATENAKKKNKVIDTGETWV